MSDKNKKNVTNFGFNSINQNKKTAMVSEIFDSVSLKYDLMNDIMSFGIHRIWKYYLIYHSNIHHGHTVLDLAGGTGDLSIKFSNLVGTTGLVVLADINNSMLNLGRKKIRDLGILNNICYVQAEAESLPFSNNIFDCIAVSFGLRNFTNIKKSLSSIYRVLKPGGKLLILDFSLPSSVFLRKIYDIYSFYIIPKIGKYIVKDSNSYRYLVESIRTYLDPNSLKKILLNIGFNKIKYFYMTFKVVVLHCAYKPH